MIQEDGEFQMEEPGNGTGLPNVEPDIPATQEEFWEEEAPLQYELNEEAEHFLDEQLDGELLGGNRMTEDQPRCSRDGEDTDSQPDVGDDRHNHRLQKMQLLLERGTQHSLDPDNGCQDEDLDSYSEHGISSGIQSADANEPGNEAESSPQVHIPRSLQGKQPLHDELSADLASRICRRQHEISHMLSVDSYTGMEEQVLDNVYTNKRETVTTWASVADEKCTTLCAFLPTVRQHAYENMLNWRKGRQNKEATKSTLLAQANQLRDPTTDEVVDNGCDRPRNRFPPSIYACQQVLQVPTPDAYEYHVCIGGCSHWWHRDTISDPAAHLKACRKGCKLCQCPLCGKDRYLLTQDRCRYRPGQSVEPQQLCWFFYDVFLQMFLDIGWVKKVQYSREEREASFYKSAEYHRLAGELMKAGLPEDRVWFFDLAADGVAWGAKKTHSVQFFILRSRDAPPELAQTMKNVWPLLVIPGPEEPKSGFSVFMAMILQLFATLTQTGGILHSPLFFSSIVVLRFEVCCYILLKIPVLFIDKILLSILLHIIY